MSAERIHDDLEVGRRHVTAGPRHRRSKYARKKARQRKTVSHRLHHLRTIVMTEIYTHVGPPMQSTAERVAAGRLRGMTDALPFALLGAGRDRRAGVATGPSEEGQPYRTILAT